MAIPNNSEDSRIMRTLYPLATFPGEAFRDLCANATVEYVQDAPIFKRGDTNTDFVFLLNGSVTLQAEGLVVEAIHSDNESAKFALAHQIPRKIDAIANGLARIVRLDAHAVNNPPPAVYNEDLGYTVIEESSTEDPDDWMTALLSLPLFEILPATSLQKILTSLKIQQFVEGKIIIENGSVVDYFYIVNKGQCLLTRKKEGEVSEIKLGPGDSFGEEYLITGMLAQETVIALTDVSLIQLDKNVFLTHIKKPSVHYIEPEDMADAQKEGSIVLDVRLPHHFESHNITGSANIPLLSLRMRLHEIPKERKIIVVCANGLASEAAAYLLTRYKLNAVALKGGMGIRDVDDENNGAGLTAIAGNGIQNTQTEGQVVAEDAPATDNADVNDDGARLQAENESLQARINELEAINAKLQADKEQLEGQNTVLSQQLERLKEILNRLTKRQ